MLLRRLSLALIGIAVIYAAVIQVIFPKYIVDDAYISFRYAQNLALHGELNWNVGEDPVEGYTGLAMQVLLAGFVRAGISPVTASHGIGLFSFWLGFLMLYLIARRLRLPSACVGGLLLLYTTLPILFTHTFSGMETMLFIALMLASLYAAVARRDGMLAGLLLLVSLTRPEGVAFSGALFAAVGWGRYGEGRDAFKCFLKIFFCAYLLPAAMYFGWRYAYYGHLLPNTFYAKSKFGLQFSVLVDIARFIRRYFAVPLLGLVVLWGVETDSLWNMLRVEIRKNKLAAYACMCTLFCGSLVWVLSHAWLVANFAHRLYVPFLPILWLFLALGWKSGFSSLEESRHEKPIRYVFVISAFLLLILYQSLFQAVKIREELAFGRQQIILHEDVHNAVGKELQRLLPYTETVIVYMDAGAIPYFSGLRAIDFGDLNDELLASRTLSPEGRIDYFFSQKAAALSFSSRDPERVVFGPEADAIVSDPRFKDYVLYKRYLPRDPRLTYYQLVYLRKDLHEKLRKEGKIPKEI